MWLDCLWLAPLVLLGLERLIRENRPILYCITLGLSIFCNYYISIMLCIFLVLYFVCEMILLPRQRGRDYVKKSLLFLGCSLLAGGLAAVMVIPAACCLMTTASADSTFPTFLSSYFSVLEMLARQMVNVETEVGLDHWPNIYSGVVCLLCLPAYLLNKKIPAKEKVVKGTLLMLMLLSFSLNIPNYIWHGMHYPNSLPCRQSFLYTIVLLTLCFEGVQGLKELTKGQIAGCFCGVAAFILVCQQVITSEDLDFTVYYLTLLFVAGYALLAYLWKTRILLRFSALLLALLLLTVETGMNMALTSVTTTSRTDYWDGTDSSRELVEQAAGQDENGFYRVEKVSRRTKNDGAWIGYDSASLFSSTTPAAVSDFYTLFGMEGNTNAYSFTGATPLMASLLSVEFQLSSGGLSESPLREYAGREDSVSLYRNLYTLGLGCMLPDGVSNYFEYCPNGDPAAAQNSLVGMTTMSGTLLREVAVSEAADDYLSFTLTEDGPIYVYVSNLDVTDVTVYINSSQKTFDNVDRGYFLDLGICKAGDSIEVIADGGQVLSATVYLFDNDVFIDWYQKMSPQNFQVDSCTNTLFQTKVTGSVTASQDGMLFLSIPYDSGWRAVVDGEEADTDTFAGTFLALDLSAGTHEISLTYHVPGLAAGAAVSLLSLAVLLVLVFLFCFRGTDRGKKFLRSRKGNPDRRTDSPSAEVRPAAEPAGNTETDDSLSRDGEDLTDEEIEQILLEEGD